MLECYCVQLCWLSAYNPQDIAATVNVKLDNFSGSTIQTMNEVESAIIKQTVSRKYCHRLRSKTRQLVQRLNIVYQALDRVFGAIAIW